LPVALFMFAGRQTSITTGDTAQSRFKLWQEGLTLMKENPVFGVGMNNFIKHRDLVAHNSFMHCYAELGFLGGTVFFGTFFFALWALFRLNSRKVVVLDPLSRQLNPYLFSFVAGAVTIMMTLSRTYIVPTYLILGVVTAHLRNVVTLPELDLRRLNSRLVQRVAVASVGFLVVIYVTCRLLVRYS
jgi:O-antigen ligase